MQVERVWLFREPGEWRTGEQHVGDLPFSEEYRREIADNTAWAWLSREREASKALFGGRWEMGPRPIS
jgi:hypothetical protein